MHTIPTKQRAPKLSHYYFRIYSKVADMIACVVGKSISNRTWPTGSKLPTIKVFSLSNYSRYSQSATGHFCNALKSMQYNISLFFDVKPEIFIVYAGFHLC